MPSTLPVSHTSVDLIVQHRPDVASLSTVTSATLHAFAGQAEAWLLAQLAQRYTVPFTVEVPLVTTLATDLSVYRLLSRRLYVTQEQMDKSGAERLWTETKETLAAILSGTLPLVSTSGALVATGPHARPWSNTMDFFPTTWDAPADDWVMDPDRYEADSDRRDLSWWRRKLL